MSVKALVRRVLGQRAMTELAERRYSVENHASTVVARQLLTDLTAMLGSKRRLWYDDVLSFAPHPPGLYRWILEQIVADDRVQPVLARDLEREARPDRVNLVPRHDLDGDPAALATFVEAERALNVRSSIYARVDGEDYRPESVVGLLRELHEAGFEIGLHTAAYLAEDAITALRTELDRFAMVYGFSASTFNTHGMHPAYRARRRRRRRFIEETRQRASEIGATLIDHNVAGTYDVLVGDSNLALNRRVSYLTRNVLHLSRLTAGTRVVFLSHPTYWTPSSASP